MSTFDDVLNDCLQTLQGFGLAQPRAAFLQGAVGPTDLTIQVGDATGFEQGVAEIGNEVIFIDQVDYSGQTLTLAPDGRGWFGTTPGTYAAGTRITMAPVWPKGQIASAVNDAIIGTYPVLFGIGVQQFPFSPAVSTYSMPADAEKVLSVVADVVGPSREQLRLNRFSFNSSAPTDAFPTGNSITLEQGGFPGRTVTVTYIKQPSEITFGDRFTASGLSETARLAVKFAACSALTAFMDTSRLPVDTAQADEYDQSKAGIGTASRISAQLYQRYLLELDTERKRLRAAVPTPIIVRTR